MGNITIQGDLTGDVPGGEVGGASNLTTAGAIPYVSAPGILNQDATALFWDATNDRLGVSAITHPTANTSLNLGLFPNGTATQSSLTLYNSNTGGNQYGQVTTVGQGAGAEMRIDTGANSGTAGAIVFRPALVERARLTSTNGNLLIGTTTDSNFKLDVATSGSAGTATLFNRTATTGSTLVAIGTDLAGTGASNASATTTRLVVRAGGAQGGTGTFEIQDSSGNAEHRFAPGAAYYQFQSANIVSNQAVGNYFLANNKSFNWSSAANLNSGNLPDLSLSRASAGVLQVGDGGSNANGTIRATRITSPSTLTLQPDNGAVATGWGSSFSLPNGSGGAGVTLAGNSSGFAFPLDVAISGTTGTSRFYDQTATTGVTKVVVRAGAGQSTTNLQEWQTSAGAVIAEIGSTGGITSTAFVRAGATSYISWFGRTNIYSPSSGVLTFYDSSETSFGRLQFGGTTSSFPALKRSTTSLEVRLADDSGYSDLTLRRSQHSGVTVADLPAAAAGNAGSIQYVTDANATTIGSTVAGGGANKVMVWSDGAAWKIFAS